MPPPDHGLPALQPPQHHGLPLLSLRGPRCPRLPASAAAWPPAPAGRQHPVRYCIFIFTILDKAYTFQLKDYISDFIKPSSEIQPPNNPCLRGQVAALGAALGDLEPPEAAQVALHLAGEAGSRGVGAVGRAGPTLLLPGRYIYNIYTLSTQYLHNIYPAAGGPDGGHLARGGAADRVLARGPHRGDGGHGRHPPALSPLPPPRRRHPLLRRGAGIQ